MKNILKYIGYGCAAMFMAFSFAACSEDKMDEINKDNGHTTDVNVKFIIPDIELRTAQNVIGGDFNTYFGSYVEYWAGTHNQLYQAELRHAECRSASTYNNIWGTIYENIRNAKIVIAKCSEGGSDEGDALSLGIAKVLLAYNAAVATDQFGDTPYTQVGDYVTFPTPEADKQEAIYDDVLKLIDSAIEDFNGAPNTLGKYDFIYGGDAKMWTKFANGLAARYTMRLLNKASDKNASLNKVLDYLSKSFDSAADQASMQYDGSNQNPLFDFEWSRDGISSCTSMYEKLMERNDPRAERVYFDAGGWFHYFSDEVEDVLAPTGEPYESQYEYAYDVFFFAEVAPIHFMSYHEALFLKAEAEARLGQDASETLQDAIAAAFANLEVNVEGAMESPSINTYGGLDPISDDALTDDDAAEYYESSVQDLFKADPLKEIMLQKYIALWGANGETLETYADIRRLKAEGKDVYGLVNPGKFPLRCGYGNDDVVSNPNIAKLYGDGQYVFTENVWWAGGSR